MKKQYQDIAKRNPLASLVLVEMLYAKHRNDKDTPITKNIDKFVPSEKKNDKKYMKRIYKDLLELQCIYDVTYLDEYFLFGFPNKSKKERAEFVGTDEYLESAKKIKTKEVEENPTLKDKYLAYTTLKEYYKRDIVPLRDFSNFMEFNAFVQKHPVFLVKKETGSLGKDIVKIDLTKDKKEPKNLFLSLLSQGQFIVEEIIQQHETMAAFHSNSVNTVRVTTYFENDNVTKLFAMFRTGTGDNVVDNASNGGICASVDLKTGIIESNGYKKSGEIIEFHPDSNIKFKGFQIPQWNELMSLADELANKVPHYNYIGWDFALTNDGWVVVEGNSRPNINSIQMCSGRGLRKILDATLGLGA